MNNQIQQNGPAPSVLVVDDDKDVLDLLSVALSAMRSYVVVPAETARIALREIAAAPRPFDVVILDIQMPGMGGIELLSEIRRRPDYSLTPVLMLTAMSDRHHAEASYRAGAQDYITKPFDYEDLFHRIEEALSLFDPDDDDSDGEPVVRKATIEHVERDLAGKTAAPPRSSLSRFIGRLHFRDAVADLSPLRLAEAELRAVTLLRSEAEDGASEMLRPGDPLPRLARGISRTTEHFDGLFCYYGADTFLVLTQGPSARFAPGPAGRFEHLLEAETSFDAARDGCRLVVGDPVPMRWRGREDIVPSIRDALGRTEHKARIAAARLRGPRRGTDQGANLYETVLREMFGDATYLGRA
jgi:DNA-binding response OmpR family regulator